MAPQLTHKHRLAAALVGYLAFCGLSLLSRSLYPVFGLVVIVGITLPLLWGRYTGAWRAMGFSRRHLGQAVLWGLISGAVSTVLGLIVLPERSFPGDLGRQLVVGLPFWLLVISPFQEFFFRGWLQSILQESLGERWGLVITTAGFTLWHYLSPIVDMAPFPLTTWTGVLSTLGAGLAYGVAFQRSRNVLAPWLGHALWGVVSVIVGAMDFVG